MTFYSGVGGSGRIILVETVIVMVSPTKLRILVCDKIHKSYRFLIYISLIPLARLPLY